MKNTPFENLKELTDSIKAGKRVVLIPPGAFFLIAIIILLIMASVTLVGAIISNYFGISEPALKAAMQFVSMGVICIFVIFPALMILQGKKNFASWMFYYSISLASISTVLIISNLTFNANLQYFNIPVFISLISSLISVLFIKYSSFALLKEFYYLLKSREA